MHWVKRTLLKSGIKDIMKRDRFELIEKHFLLSNPDQQN